MTPEEIALKLLHDIASCGGEVCECAGCGCRDAIAAALTAERERAEAYRLELATRDAGIAAVLKADGVDYTDELSAWMQLAAAYRAEREAREKAEYELQRWKEVAANKPDWEKLWAEQVEAREKADAERDEQARLKWEAYEYNKTLLARAEKAEAERDLARKCVEMATRAVDLANERINSIRDTALDEAADVADQWTQPGTPADPCWLATGNELGKVRDAILALKEPGHD